MSPSSTIVFQSREDLEQGLVGELLQRVGNGAFVQEVKPTGRDAMQATVGFVIPKLVRDPKSGEGLFKFFRYPDVGTLRFAKREGRWASERVHRKDFLKGLQREEKTMIARAERALVRSTKSRLVQIQPVGTGLNPIKSILIAVNEYDKVPTKEFEEHARYVRFLASIGFVRVEKSHVVPGPEMEKTSRLTGEHATDHEFYDRLLGEVVDVGYSHLVEDLRIQHIVPIVRTAHAYYWPSANLEKPMEFEAKDFMSQISRMYRKYSLPKTKVTSYLVEMDRAGIVEKRGASYTGVDEVWSSYRQELPKFGSL